MYVSTEMQSTEGYSIDGQINQIKEYCDFHHFEVKDIYADRGISGKSMNRPELQRMLKDAKRRQYRLCYDLQNKPISS